MASKFFVICHYKTVGLHQGFQRTIENPVHFGDRDTVVDHGDTRRFSCTLAILHLLLIEHTTAAVDDNLVRRKIIGEAGTGGEIIRDICVCICFQPSGKLHGADIAALAVMGTALRDQYLIAVLQGFQGVCAPDQTVQITFIAREKDRERGHWDIGGSIGGDPLERLRIGDYQSGASCKLCESRFQLRILTTEHSAVVIEPLASTV